MEILIIILGLIVFSLLILGYVCGKKVDEWLSENKLYFGKFLANIWALCIYMFIFGIVSIIIGIFSSENALPYVIIAVISAAIGVLIVFVINKKKPSNGTMKTMMIMLGVFWGNSWNRAMRIMGRLLGR